MRLSFTDLSSPSPDFADDPRWSPPPEEASSDGEKGKGRAERLPREFERAFGTFKEKLRHKPLEERVVCKGKSLKGEFPFGELVLCSPLLPIKELPTPENLRWNQTKSSHSVKWEKSGSEITVLMTKHILRGRRGNVKRRQDGGKLFRFRFKCWTDGKGVLSYQGFLRERAGSQRTASRPSSRRKRREPSSPKIPVAIPLEMPASWGKRGGELDSLSYSGSDSSLERSSLRELSSESPRYVDSLSEKNLGKRKGSREESGSKKLCCSLGFSSSASFEDASRKQPFTFRDPSKGVEEYPLFHGEETFHSPFSTPSFF